MESFSSKVYGTQTTGRIQFEGEFVIRPTSNHMRYTPSGKGDTLFRMVPKMVDGVEEPLITNTEGIISLDGLTGAFVEVDLVTFFGKNSISMICPPPPKGERLGIVHAFHRFIEDYEKNNQISCDPNWRRWLGIKHEGDYSTPPTLLKRPTPHLLIQGYLFEHAGKQQTDKEGRPHPRYPVVLCISQSGRNNLLDQLLEQADINAPWSTENNLIGDILSLANGKAIRVFLKQEIEGKIRKSKYYVEALEEAYPLTVEDAVKVWAPWEEVLNLDTPMEELALRLAENFSATAVFKAFETSPVYSQVLSYQPLINLFNAENKGSAVQIPSPKQETTMPSIRTGTPVYESQEEETPFEEEQEPTFQTSAQDRIEQAKQRLAGLRRST